MNILSIDYTLKHQSIDIYVSGCNGPHCNGCHNPTSWDFSIGVPYDADVEKIISGKYNDFECMIQNIMIFGGEPLDQDIDKLLELLQFLSKFDLPMWLFTRYDISEVPESVKELVSYIKTGRYEPEQACERNIHYGIELATLNQKIYKKGVDFYT